MTIAHLVAAARASGNYTELCAAVPFAAFMGLSARRTDEGLVAHMRFQDHQIGNPTLPALHGGSLSALLAVAPRLDGARI